MFRRATREGNSKMKPKKKLMEKLRGVIALHGSTLSVATFKPYTYAQVDVYIGERLYTGIGFSKKHPADTWSDLGQRIAIGRAIANTARQIIAERKEDSSIAASPLKKCLRCGFEGGQHAHSCLDK